MIVPTAFAAEQFSPELVREIEPLLRAHYAEIAHYQDIPLDPDWQDYEACWMRGCLRIFSARQEGVLVGYAVFFVRRNLHYKSSLQAVQDVLFIHAERRGFGRDFIDWCDARLREEGVQVVYHHTKAAADFGPMLRRLGYEHVDQIYGRRLDR